jgi:hypothetical protein
MTAPRPCTLSDGFRLWEKLVAQTSFFGFTLAGCIGLLLADWRWAIPYLVVFVYGVPGIVMRYLSCPRCPHLFQFGDCLQLPPRIARWLVKAPTNAPFSTAERAMFWFIFLFLPLYPLPWLLAQPLVLAVFVIAAATWYLSQLLYFCRRCRVQACPFNRVPLSSSNPIL